MNNYNSFNNYGGYNPINTNIILVTSLEEALFRSNINGSDMVYFHQTEHIFYRVKVDMRGEKSWQTMRYGSGDSEANVNVTKNDLTALEERLRKMEELILKENANEQSNG